MVGVMARRAAAFGTAAITASLVVVVLSGEARMRPDRRGAAQGPATPTVCAGGDGVLRASAAASCPAGQTKVPLADAAPDANPEADRTRQDPRMPRRADVDRLAEIAQRIDALEHAPLFEVVDTEDRPLLRVSSGAVRVYDPSGRPSAGMYATEIGGYFLGTSQDGALVIAVGVSGDRAGVRILEADALRLDAGRQESGNYALVVSSGNGGRLAGIGESKAGTGALVIGDAAGRTRASMTIVDGKGAVTAFHANGAAIAALTEGATHGGLLAIGDPAGEPMVKMGVANDRYGVVLAGPAAGFPLIPRSGLPGSYFFGCAGGPSCRE